MHLLSRLLAFDPSRRCSAEEALTHEYLHCFEAIDMQMGGLACNMLCLALVAQRALQRPAMPCTCSAAASSMKHCCSS